ncbi:MAG TPA: hypothetical protein EYG91_06370 [Aquifex aeolicus]|nr:hypothetical protein [Aquifex aeolicus]
MGTIYLITYNFVKVVDDALMGITHVIRDEDLCKPCFFSNIQFFICTRYTLSEKIK